MVRSILIRSELEKAEQADSTACIIEWIDTHNSRHVEACLYTYPKIYQNPRSYSSNIDIAHVIVRGEKPHVIVVLRLDTLRFFFGTSGFRSHPY